MLVYRFPLLMYRTSRSILLIFMSLVSGSQMTLRTRAQFGIAMSPTTSCVPVNLRSYGYNVNFHKNCEESDGWSLLLNGTIVIKFCRFSKSGGNVVCFPIAVSCQGPGNLPQLHGFVLFRGFPPMTDPSRAGGGRRARESVKLSLQREILVLGA